MKSVKVNRIVGVTPGEIELKPPLKKIIKGNFHAIFILVVTIYLIIAMKRIYLFEILLIIVFTCEIFDSTWYLKITDDNCVIAKRLFKKYIIGFDDLISIERCCMYKSDSIVLYFNKNNKNKRISFPCICVRTGWGGIFRLIEEIEIEEFMSHFKMETIEVPYNNLSRTIPSHIIIEESEIDEFMSNVKMETTGIKGKKRSKYL